MLPQGRAGCGAAHRPWAHGECRNGGFPDWLLHKGIPLRQNHPAYLALVRAWYRSIYRQVRGLLYRDGGPIVGIQLENELVDNSDHLAALKRIAVEEGFEVPLYTVTGWNAVSGARIPTAEVLPVFAAYPDAPWTQHRDPLPLSPQYLFNPTRNDTAVGADLLHTAAPDGWQLPYDRYPFATCEIGAGQQSTYHRRVRISGMDAYALSLVKLGCGNNLIGYYMYHGGTNPIGRDSTLQESRATGYPNDYPILNYDFATALSQYGETRPQYRWLNLLHLLAADFGRELARMEYVSSLTHPTPEDRQTLRCCLRTDGTAGFVFVNHHQRHAALCPVSDVVLDTGTVCFPPITVAGDLAFLFPFGLSLGGRTLRWATAQPICRSGDTWFFAAIPGIPARYRFADGTLVTAGQGIAVQTAGPVRLVTLPLGQALWLRRLGQRIVLGQGCDLYEEDGTIRAVLDGTVFRAPIMIDSIKPVVKNWKKPITIARHAYGDVYKCTEFRIPGAGKAELVFTGADGSEQRATVFDFEGAGVLQGQYNKDDSIRSFARSCFNYALDVKQDLWFGAKDTISKKYDHTFKDIFQEVYDAEYKAKFEAAGITYFYSLIDDIVARVIRSEGGFVWACKNYDGDVMSDMVSTAFGSLAMMTSVLVSPDGKYEFEAAHGTVTRHYYKYLKGEKTSTNPMATIFAWSGAFKKRGELDGLPELVKFGEALEAASLQTLNDGIMTKDLCGLAEGITPTAVDSEGFIKAIRTRLEAKLA